MANKVRLPATEVRPVAERVRDLLLSDHFLSNHSGAGANVRCEIAGSLRRGEREVGDVEMVIEPLYDTDLFGICASRTSAALDGALVRCLQDGLLAWDTETPRNGSRYKRLIFPALGGLPLDLFIAREENWGNILAIRTGDADFSRALVTHRFKGGLLPNWMRHAEGRLFARAKGYPDFQEDPLPSDYTENVLACPTEDAFFSLLWLDVPPMRMRCASAVRDLSRQALKNQQAARSESRLPSKGAYHA